MVWKGCDHCGLGAAVQLTNLLARFESSPSHLVCLCVSYSLTGYSKPLSAWLPVQPTQPQVTLSGANCRWLLIPVSVAVLQAAVQQRAAQQAAQAAAEAERRRNPFASMWRDMRAGTRGGRASQDGGPVVDAEFVVLDKEGRASGDSKGR